MTSVEVYGQGDKGSGQGDKGGGVDKVASVVGRGSTQLMDVSACVCLQRLRAWNEEFAAVSS